MIITLINIIYNISNYTINEISPNKPETCMSKEYGTKINEFKTKNQISFSCIVKDENIKILFYNKNDLTLTNNSFSINALCEYRSSLSRVYFNDDKNYYIYSCFNNNSNQSYSDENHKDENYGNNNKNINNSSNIKEVEEKIEKNNTILILIIIIVALIIIIILLMIIIIKYKTLFKKKAFEANWKKGKEDEKLTKEIMTDLLPNDQ